MERGKVQKVRYEDQKREIGIYRQLTRRRMELQALVFLPDFSEFITPFNQGSPKS